MMRLMLRTIIVCIGFVFAWHISHAQKNTLSPLEIELLVPISTPSGDRVIAMDRYPRIHILIKNVSEQPQRIWKDWNSWGWFNLSLQMAIGDSIVQITRKRPTHWDGDFPDFWVIQNGETVVLEVDLTTGEWSGFPDLYGESLSAKLSVIYENKADILAREFGIWVGKLTSEEIGVVMR